MDNNALDNYQEYLANISRPMVSYHAALTGRQIIYCSLKRYQYVEDPYARETLSEPPSNTIIQVNDADMSQKEGEPLSDYKDRRTEIKPLKDVLKEVYPDIVHIEPDRSIRTVMEADGLTRIEIDEDYEYYTLMASIIISNQTNEMIGMDNNMQIILPKIDDLMYKKNDKVIFDYKNKQYIYVVKEIPETTLNDIFLLQLNLMNVRDNPHNKE